MSITTEQKNKKGTMYLTSAEMPDIMGCTRVFGNKKTMDLYDLQFVYKFFVYKFLQSKNSILQMQNCTRGLECINPCGARIQIRLCEFAVWG